MSLASTLKTYYINLAQDKKYPIVFGEGAIHTLNKNDYGDTTKAVLVTNPTIKDACGDLINDLIQLLPFDVFVHVIEDGEEHKNLDTMASIVDACVEHQLGRQDMLIAVGGGVVGDITGFAAAAYLRGISLMQVPTSLLAQVDAAIGGKTGVNHSKGKNLIGAFYQPVKILIDPTALGSLKEKEMIEGLSEVIKYGIIKDKPLFWYIEQHSDAIKTYQYNDCPDNWNFLIEKSIQNKAMVVSQDEKEHEYREVLNYGHTIAHAIEQAFGYKEISHGQAVAIGMVVEAKISQKVNQLSDQNFDRIFNLIKTLGFDLNIPSMQRDMFFSAIKMDKKTRKDNVRFVLPVDIGQTKTLDNIDKDLIIKAVNSICGGSCL